MSFCEYCLESPCVCTIDANALAQAMLRSSPRIGSLFSGYGGLDMGVTAALGGSVAWHVEFDKAPSKILAHHWPDVPNYGDVTAVDWLAVEPVDIITGGSPCQDLSHAGKRQGMTEGTRSNLWVAMREAIAQLRPSLVVWENVRGAYSAAADSEVEPCAGCVGERPGVSLRALGRVLGDLSDLGYDCRWHGLRAADVGAPHGRFRVFVVAHAHDRAGHGEWARSESQQGGALAAVATDLGHERARASRAGRDGSADSSLLPTPVARDWKGAGPADLRRHDPNLSAISALLPTPAVNDMGEGKTPEAWDEWTAKMPVPVAVRRLHGKSLAIEAQRLLPTPNAGDAKQGYVSAERHAEKKAAKAAEGINLQDDLPQVATTCQDWGIYADAIARWEALTRPAPPPTQPSKKGTPQLSPAFSEWLMGLPEGHVTGVPGLSRNDMLKALGNGVVWQQAAAAIRFLLSVQAVAA